MDYGEACEKSFNFWGGAGFLGTYLTERLIEKNVDVTVVDNLSTTKNIYLPKDADLILSNIEDFKTKQYFDYVIHLASRPSPEDYVKHQIDTLISNSIGTKVMLDIAKRSNAVFLYTSSSEIYGNANVLPTPESYFGNVNPNGKRSCYDEGKRFSEALVMAYFREFGTKVIIQRPFNVYGPRIRGDGQYGRVVPRFILLALKNHPIEICGDGNQTRSFLYISDWIDATLKMLKSKRTSGQVFNVGSDEQVTIGKLAIMIKRLTNSRSKIVNVRPREDDVRYRAADITKVKEVISWKPTVSLEEGLLKTTQWYGKKLDLLHL